MTKSLRFLKYIETKSDDKSSDVFKRYLKKTANYACKVKHDRF